VIALFEAMPSRANSLKTVASSKRVWKKETNPSREQENAVVFANRISWKKSQSLHQQKSPRLAQQMHIMKEKIVTLKVIKSFVCRPEMGPKQFDKFKPEPGPSWKARPDLQLCCGTNKKTIRIMYLYV